MSKSRKRLIKNIFSMIILQGSNYIFPLITFPFLVRNLGIEYYGILVFCLALMQILNVIVDYGFNISATREISIVKNEHKKVNEIFNKVMSIKIILTLITILVSGLFLTFIPFFEIDNIAILISLLIIIGNTLFPLWLYQGLERMSFITYINIGVKLIVTILIILFIQNRTDLYLAIFLQTLYYLVPGLISIYLVKKYLNINFKFITKISTLKKELIKTRHAFLTNLWINFYVQGPAIFLSIVSNVTATGNYGIGQKVQGAFSGLAQPFVQAIYPYICELYGKDKPKFNKFSNILIVFSVILTSFISIILILCSSFLIYIILGEHDDQLSALLKLFAFTVFFSILNTVLARILHAMNLSHKLNRSYFYAAIIFIGTSIPLSLNYNEFGMAISVILAEGVVFFLNLLTYTKNSSIDKQNDILDNKNY